MLATATAALLLALIPQFHLWTVRGKQWNGAYASLDVHELLYSAYIKALIDGRPLRNDPFAGRSHTPESPMPQSPFSIQFVPSLELAFLGRAIDVTASTVFIILAGTAGLLASRLCFGCSRQSQAMIVRRAPEPCSFCVSAARQADRVSLACSETPTYRRSGCPLYGDFIRRPRSRCVLSVLWGTAEVGVPAVVNSTPRAIVHDQMIPVLRRLKEFSSLNGSLVPERPAPIVFSPDIGVNLLLPTWSSQGTLLDAGGLDFGNITRQQQKNCFTRIFIIPASVNNSWRRFSAEHRTIRR